MKHALPRIVIALMAVTIALLSWALVYYARDELTAPSESSEEHVRNASAAGDESGRPVVRLSAQSQAAAGIVVQPLKSVQREAAFEAYGGVLNLQPLAEARARYMAAVAEARAARATLAAAESEYRRMEMLFRDDRNVSEQAMQSAQARYRSEQVRQAASDTTIASLRDALRGAWGDTVTQWAVNPDSQNMHSLLQRSAFLVQLVLPHDVPRSAFRNTVTVAPTGAPGAARPARFVSDSPQIDAAFPGETYFYLVHGEGWRTGMRVVARIKRSGSAQDGVVVPRSAVVWHAGKAWTYVREDAESFARFEVSTTEELEDGWFNANGFDETAEVAVSGAQLLLSEELKYQIRNENED